MLSFKNHDYPPYVYLLQVLEHYPKAGLTYMEVWKRRDKNNRYTVAKKEVRDEFLMSLAMFRHNILLLAKEGLINVIENKNKIIIELVDYNEGEEES